MENQTYEFRFMQQKVGLKSEAEPALVEQVMSLASIKLSEAEKRVKNGAPHQIAILALLDLAEEYVRAKQKVGEHKKELTEKSSHLLRLIEAELK